MHDNTYL